MAPAVVLDTSDELWVEAQLPAFLIGKARPGDIIHLSDGATGKVLSVGHTLDPKTRSAKLVGTIPVSAGLALGQMVTLSIHRKAAVSGFDVPAQVGCLAGRYTERLRAHRRPASPCCRSR